MGGFVSSIEEKESAQNRKVNRKENSRVRIGRITLTFPLNQKIDRYSCNPKIISETIRLDNNVSEAEVITDTKKSRKVNHQIH